MPEKVYPTLRELFINRVIRIEAVQRERAAAIEEARSGRTEDVTEEDVELFFDFGIIPGDAGAARSPLWPITTVPIGSPDSDTPVLSALERAVLAALGAWHQVVRDLRRRKIVATGEKRESVMIIYDDRSEIGPETWLCEGLWFDVRSNTICTIRQNVGFGSRRVDLWDEITVRETAEPDVEAAPPSGEGNHMSLRWPRPDELTAKQQIAFKIMQDDGRFSKCRNAEEMLEVMSIAKIERLLFTPRWPKNANGQLEEGGPLQRDALYDALHKHFPVDL